MDFKEFIVSLLRRANLNKRNIDEFSGPAEMDRFLLAFTHRSFDPVNNYELVEYEGDVVVNTSVAQYIRERFPKVINVKWLNRLYHNLKGKQSLFELARDTGFFEYVRYDKREGVVTDIVSLLEDVFESFIGTLTNMINSARARGVGYAVSYRVIASCFNGRRISIRIDDVFDVTSRIKEMYESVLKWGDFHDFTNCYYDRKQGKYACKVTGFEDARHIAAGFSRESEDEAKKQAFQRAMWTLTNRADRRGKRKGYGFVEKLGDPYAQHARTRQVIRTEVDDDDKGKGKASEEEEEEEDIKEFPGVPDEFVQVMRDIYRQAGVREESVKDFTDMEAMMEYRLALIDPTYDDVINNDLAKFIGDRAVEMAVTEYLVNRFRNVPEEGWQTRMKQFILKPEHYMEYIAGKKLREYMLYGEGVADMGGEDRRRKGEIGLLKSLLGAIILVVDRKRAMGVGYTVIYNILSLILGSVTVPMGVKQLMDPATRFKEVYQRKGWNKARGGNIAVTEREDDEGVRSVTVIVYGYPKASKPLPYYRKKLAEVTRPTKREAMVEAKRKALDILFRVYGIRS